MLALATANPHKVAEIEAILAAAGAGDRIVLVPRPAGVGEVVEDADTLIGNARLKAVAVAAASGTAAVADDTALEVDALGGAPGVRSARYAGDDGDAAANVAKLLQELDGVAPAARTARFRTVALVRWPDGREVWGEGVVEGTIAASATGGSGFGYDPVFIPAEGDGSTFAEMAAQAKHAISHRGRAVRALLELLG